MDDEKRPTMIAQPEGQLTAPLIFGRLEVAPANLGVDVQL